MIVFGYGISLDGNHLTFAVLDFDRTKASVQYADSFRGSIYYDEKAPIYDYQGLERRLRNGELRFVIEIPAGFERDLIRGHHHPLIHTRTVTANPPKIRSPRRTNPQKTPTQRLDQLRLRVIEP